MLALPHKITSDSRKYIYIIVTARLSKGWPKNWFSLHPAYTLRDSVQAIPAGGKHVKSAHCLENLLTLHKCVYFLEDTCMVEI